ncbi:hypothetical protein TNIN_475611 [Trichonephila inaurata madagascariensis]|uniref:Uncharacterized protein n=1 Tax=Trichonephila inaurata madagascariensis TaxID=2747483 RepID=A0A8X6YPE2_9ARAC|nr:hypothetical protein TNIN_475611 [Trichonephila inaurata madagascariensis]
MSAYVRIARTADWVQVQLSHWLPPRRRPFKAVLLSSGSPTAKKIFSEGGESSTESSPSPFCEEDHPFPRPWEGRRTYRTPTPLREELSLTPLFSTSRLVATTILSLSSPRPHAAHARLFWGDESSTSPNLFFDERACRDEDHTFQTIQNSHHRLNPQVLLIRSNFGESGGYGELTTTSSVSLPQKPGGPSGPDLLR